MRLSHPLWHLLVSVKLKSYCLNDGSHLLNITRFKMMNLATFRHSLSEITAMSHTALKKQPHYQATGSGYTGAAV